MKTESWCHKTGSTDRIIHRVKLSKKKGAATHSAAPGQTIILIYQRFFLNCGLPSCSVVTIVNVQRVEVEGLLLVCVFNHTFLH